MTKKYCVHCSVNGPKNYFLDALRLVVTVLPLQTSFSGEIHWRLQNIAMFVLVRFVSPPIFWFSALLAEAINPRINLASLREFITLRHFFSYARAYVCRRCYAPAEGKEIMENISSCGWNNKFKRASISWDQKREQILSAIDINSLTSKSAKMSFDLQVCLKYAQNISPEESFLWGYTSAVP